MNSHPPGKEFEIEVENLLTALGYEVTRNIQIAGAQIDLIGKRKSDVLGDIIVVECKDYNDSVGTEEFAEFQSKLMSAKSAYPEARGCIIARGEFTKYAKDRARVTGVTLITRAQLLNSLLNCDSWLTRFAYNYEQSEMFHLYVEPKCIWRNQDPVSAKEKSTPLLESLVAWAIKAGQSGAILLGDYGTGKTVSCERLTYTLAKRKLSGVDPDSPIPLLFYLRDYYRTLDLRSMITDRLVNDLGVNLPFETFMQYLQQGVFCVVLDGFDEMAMRVDAQSRTRNLVILQTLSAGRSKVLITGRPGYFPTDHEIEEIAKSEGLVNLPFPQQFITPRQIPKFSLIDVHLFGRDEISKYFDKYYSFAKKTGREVHEIKVRDLSKIYNLMSLAERPVLLNLILETGPEILERSESKFTAGELYRRYTRAWIERELSKGEVRRLIDPQLKLIFMQELAWDMFSRNVFTVNYQNSLPDNIIEYFGTTGSQEFDYLDSDIRTCSYIVRDEVGNYTFAHKSFMEYFVAEKIKFEIEKGNIEVFRKRLISSEIMGFLVDIHSEEVTELIKGWANIAQGAPFDNNVIRYFSKLPATESVEFFLESIDSKHLVGKSIRSIFERVLNSARARDDQAQDLSLALWNIAQLNPYPSVREMAKEYMQRVGWGQVDQVELFAGLMIGATPRSVARRMGVSIDVVRAHEKEWLLFKEAYPRRDKWIAILSEFQPIDLERNELKRIAHETMGSPALIRSLANVFGRNGMVDLVQLLLDLKLDSNLRRQISDEIATEAASRISKSTGLEERAVGELLRKSKMDFKAVQSRLESIPKNRKRVLLREVNQISGEPEWLWEKRLRIFAAAAKHAGLFDA